MQIYAKLFGIFYGEFQGARFFQGVLADVDEVIAVQSVVQRW